MDKYKKASNRKASCLECGTDMGPYARPNKKFCCDNCRFEYHNHHRYEARVLREKVNTILDRNYEVLNQCLSEKKLSIGLHEIISLGFNPAYVTSQLFMGSYHEYTCYDIAFRISGTKVFNIHRMFVHL